MDVVPTESRLGENTKMDGLSQGAQRLWVKTVDGHRLEEGRVLFKSHFSKLCGGRTLVKPLTS